MFRKMFFKIFNEEPPSMFKNEQFAAMLTNKSERKVIKLLGALHSAAVFLTWDFSCTNELDTATANISV